MMPEISAYDTYMSGECPETMSPRLSKGDESSVLSSYLESIKSMQDTCEEKCPSSERIPKSDPALRFHSSYFHWEKGQITGKKDGILNCISSGRLHQKASASFQTCAKKDHWSEDGWSCNHRATRSKGHTEGQKSKIRVPLSYCLSSSGSRCRPSNWESLVSWSAGDRRGEQVLISRPRHLAKWPWEDPGSKGLWVYNKIRITRLFWSY